MYIRNGKVVVQIAIFTHGFYHFIEYNATKKFCWDNGMKKFDKKQTTVVIGIITLPTGVRSTDLCKKNK